MSFTYDQRKRPQAKDNSPPPPKDTISNTPNFSALMNGTARPTAAQKGQPFDLDAAMKTKMENAFGDLSAVKLYRSQAVADAGAEAIAQGNEIAFAPGMANFSTRSGQERLGHELSHVMSQRSGQVRGNGFLVDSALEARADREGAMAAAGQQVYTGPVTHAISDASPSLFAAGAMQAKRGGNQEQQRSPVAGPELIHERASWRDARYDWKHRFENESGRRMREEIAPSAMETASKIAAKNRVGDTRNYLRRGSARDRARWEVMDSMLDDDED